MHSISGLKEQMLLDHASRDLRREPQFRDFFWCSLEMKYTKILCCYYLITCLAPVYVKVSRRLAQGTLKFVTLRSRRCVVVQAALRGPRLRHPWLTCITWSEVTGSEVACSYVGRRLNVQLVRPLIALNYGEVRCRSLRRRRGRVVSRYRFARTPL